MKPFNPRRGRTGLSLLEMAIATATMATLMAAVVVLVRTGYGAWEIYENDLEVTENAYATLRHIVRNVRQADAVTAISTAADTSGNLSILTESAAAHTWDHNAGLDAVYFDSGTGAQLLTWKIDELTFIGYEADGTTQTTTVGDIHMIECRVQVTLPHGATETLDLACKAWLRSW